MSDTTKSKAFLTSHSDALTVQRAARVAPYGYLTKPFQIKEVRAAIEVAIAKSQLERQLRDADRWFASTLRCVQDGVVVTHPDGQVRFMNAAAEQMTGWLSEEAAGKNVTSVVCFADEALVRNAATVALDSQAVVPIRHARPLLSRRGGTLAVDESAAPVTDDRRALLGSVLVLRDATTRLRQEHALRDSELRFRQAFDNAPLGMAAVSMDGRLLQANLALARLLRRPVETLLGQDFGKLWHDQDVAHVQDRLKRLLAAETSLVQFEARLCLDAGQHMHALVSASLLKEDEASCLLLQIHDLTEQKLAAEQLAAIAEDRIRLEVLERTARERGQFFSRVSHEMRTPLNAILGFAQLLQVPSENTAKAGVYAGHIRRAGDHLLHLVNDILDVQRASDGALNLNIIDVDICASVSAVCELLVPMAERQDVNLEWKPCLTTWVRADETRLQQVLMNLLTNGIKYCRTGGTVKVTVTAAGGRVTLNVTDNGIGMTADQLARLFQPFDRLGQESSRIEGIGLGLVITKALLEQMDGTIGFESQPRVGTVVRVTLPLASRPSQQRLQT